MGQNSSKHAPKQGRGKTLNVTQGIFKHVNGDFDYLVKLIIVGASSVGKTSFLKYFTEETWNSSTISTIGVDFQMKTVNIGDSKVRIQFWDTAGQERKLTTSYYKNSAVAFVMADLTNKNSFEQSWLFVKEVQSEEIPIVIILNKSDIDSKKREITKEMIQKYYDANLKVCITSSKTGENVKNIVLATVKDLLHHCIEMPGSCDTPIVSQEKNVTVSQQNNFAVQFKAKSLKINQYGMICWESCILRFREQKTDEIELHFPDRFANWLFDELFKLSDVKVMVDWSSLGMRLFSNNRIYQLVFLKEDFPGFCEVLFHRMKNLYPEEKLNLLLHPEQRKTISSIDETKTEGTKQNNNSEGEYIEKSTEEVYESISVETEANCLNHDPMAASGGPTMDSEQIVKRKTQVDEPNNDHDLDVVRQKDFFSPLKVVKLFSERFSDLELENNLALEFTINFLENMKEYQEIVIQDMLPSSYMEAFSNVIEFCPHIKKVSFHHCSLSQNDVYCLVKCLLDHQFIHTLSLKGNLLNDKRTVSYLCSLIQKNRSIKSLVLQRCFRTGIDITSIIQSCQGNTGLKTLNLGSCRLQDDFGVFLLKCLEKLHLETIILTDNNISQDTMNQLIKKGKIHEINVVGFKDENQDQSFFSMTDLQRELLQFEINSDEIKFGERKLGSGNQGFVYEGYWNYSPVAIKVLSTSDYTKNSLNELKIMSLIRHKYIVPCYGVAFDKKEDRILQIYDVKGGNLTHLMRKKILNERQKISIALDICRAMSYLHSFKPPIRHLDLKPDNILYERTICEDESIGYVGYLSDFGLSKFNVTNQTVGIGKIQGTPRYSSPEMLLDNLMSTKGDVYSFGIVFYELYFEMEAFPELSLSMLVQALKQESRPPISEISGQEHYSEVREIIENCWKHNRKERPGFHEIVPRLWKLLGNAP